MTSEPNMKTDGLLNRPKIHTKWESGLQLIFINVRPTSEMLAQQWARIIFRLIMLIAFTSDKSEKKKVNSE